MGVLARHHGHGGKLLPPRNLVEPLIDRGPHVGEHWYWLGEFDGGPFESQAEIRWQPPREKFARSFCVTRLLWGWDRASGMGMIDVKRLTLRNTCGVPACVNPTHWEARQRKDVAPAGPLRSQLPLDSGAYVSCFSGSRYSRDATLTHIAREESTHSVCGRAKQVTAPRATVIVTCVECQKTWLALGKTLEPAL
jgi:hypothetical protein